MARSANFAQLGGIGLGQGVVRCAVDMLDGVSSYYRAVMELLGHVETRSPSTRRFGAEADAHWKAFAGDLTLGDRMDLLIRDADAEWPGSVGARTIYALPAVSEQDALGPDWIPLDSMAAADLWREMRGAKAPAPANTPVEALQRVAKAWGLTLSDTKIPALAAAERYVVAGPSAIAALIAAFAKRSELDWAVQVTAVATSPAHRQIAAAAGALLNLTRPVSVLTSSQKIGSLRGATLITSADASPDDRAHAAALVGS